MGWTQRCMSFGLAAILVSAVQASAATVFVGGGFSGTGVEQVMAFEWADGSLTKTGGANPGAISGMKIGDINGDKASDLVLGLATGSGGNIAYYYSTDITSAVKKSTTYQTSTRQIVVSDLNNDGYSDVFVKSGSSLVSTFLGSGTGLAASHTSFVQNTVYNNAAIALIDATGAGHATHVVIGRNDQYGVEFRALSGTSLVTDTSIQASSAIQTGTVNPISLLAGHFTSAVGRQDLIVVTNIGNAGDDVLYYQNTGTGFSSKGSLAASGVLNSRLPGAVGDVNGDGLDDAVILTGSSLQVFSFSLDGNNVVKSIIANLTLSAYGTAVTSEVVDLNGDGRSDVLVGFSNGTLAAFLADSTGALTFNASVSTGQTSLTSLAAIAVPEPTSAALLATAGLLALVRPHRKTH